MLSKVIDNISCCDLNNRDILSITIEDSKC